MRRLMICAAIALPVAVSAPASAETALEFAAAGKFVPDLLLRRHIPGCQQQHILYLRDRRNSVRLHDRRTPFI